MTTPGLTLWQRNLIGFVVAAVAVAVIGVTELYPKWVAYRATAAPAHVVAKGADLSISGQTWRLGAIHHLNAVPRAPAVTLPAHTTLVVVTISRVGTPPVGECSPVLTDGLRRWPAQTSEFRVPLISGATDRCAVPGTLQATFLLPSDAVPTAVDLVDSRKAILLRVLL